MCLDLIHPSPNSFQIYPPFPIYPILGLLFLSLNLLSPSCAAQSVWVHGFALEHGGLTGGYAFKGN